MNRDEWMALKIAEQVGDAPVLALLGNRHTLQRVKWNDGIVSPSVAEILAATGRTAKTFLQNWPEPCSADRAGRFYDVDRPATLLTLQQIFSVMNANTPKSAIGVVNGVITWECKT
jgi:hypothetical protein